MGVEPDATPAPIEHGDVWRESDHKRAQERVKRCFFRKVLLDLKNGDLRHYYISIKSYISQIKDLC